MVIHAVIVAAGSGSRFGGPLPKQFMPLSGRPVVMHSIEALREAIPRVKMTLVISHSEEERWKSLCEEYGFDSPDIVFGGETRFDSVRNALKSVSDDTDLVLVHDGARPFASAEMIQRIIAAFENTDVQGAVPAIKVTDSLRQIMPAGHSEVVDRTVFRAVQTPQAFRASLLLEAYDKADSSARFTDDASVMEAAGFNNLVITEGSADNIKITNPHDIIIAEAIDKIRLKKC